MANEYQVQGAEDIQKALQGFTGNFEARALRGALGAGMKVIMGAAKENVPVAAPSAENLTRYGGYAGALRDSMRVNTYNKNGVVSAVLKVGGKYTYYAHMVEFGTAAHFIASKNKKLSFGGKVFSKVNHPGAVKSPFLLPAFDGHSQEAAQTIGNYLRDRIEKENLKLAGPDE